MKWQKLFYWLLTLFVVYLIIEVLRKILGGSLGYEEMVIALLVANLGYTFALHTKISSIDAKISGHLGWHRGREQQRH